jgi:hypothetical protein
VTTDTERLVERLKAERSKQRNPANPDLMNDLGRLLNDAIFHVEAAALSQQGRDASFQAGVSAWMQQCFVQSLYSNMTERGDRLLEEVLELLQSSGYDPTRVPTLVDYVFARPVGEPAQEVGGVMVTLAGYCFIAGLDMHADGARELQRITQPDVMAKIRRKQEAKNALHFDTPLPGSTHPPTEPVAGVGDVATDLEAIADFLKLRDESLLPSECNDEERAISALEIAKLGLRRLTAPADGGSNG